ncbi:hypothetical protein BS78_08G154400 [Paspalum vaginatum]|nr:hypothetical protein BS78_08G154400 [Paspalum vaginatum]
MSSPSRRGRCSPGSRAPSPPTPCCRSAAASWCRRHPWAPTPCCRERHAAGDDRSSISRYYSGPATLLQCTPRMKTWAWRKLAKFYSLQPLIRLLPMYSSNVHKTSFCFSGLIELSCMV